MKDLLSFKIEKEDVPAAIIPVSDNILKTFVNKSREDVKYIAEAESGKVVSIPLGSSCDIIGVSKNGLLMLLDITDGEGNNHSGFVPTKEIG